MNFYNKLLSVQFAEKNMSKKHDYTNGEVTVIWKPEICTHSGNCVKNLPEVFKPKERPWVKIENASSEETMKAVDKCPSGALSYYKNEK
jgi:uncharacterized Fe-S cluster protein YjdI